MKKYRLKLKPEEINELKRLSEIDFSTYTEADVREEYIVPLLIMLGYRKDLDYSVEREESFSLNDAFNISIGSRKIRLDYLFSVRKQYFWLIDAKTGKEEKEIANEDIFQAYFYSLHPEIDATYFAVCNGWHFNLYERDKLSNSLEPIISIKSSEIKDRFLEIDKYIGSTQILSTLKEFLLNKIKKVLSAEIMPERLDEFLNETRNKIRQIRPTVLENFRKTSKIAEEEQNVEFEEYLKTLQPFQLVDTLFQSSNTLPAIHRASKTIFESERFKYGSSNHFLLFHYMFLEEMRFVNYWYYTNVLYFLLFLCRNKLEEVDYPNSKKTKTIDLTHSWIELIFTKFERRRDIRILSLYEALQYRQLKFYLITSKDNRDMINRNVEFLKYIFSEEELTIFKPHSAREMINLLFENTQIRCLKFIDKFYSKSNREFKENLALEHYNDEQKAFETIFNENEKYYNSLLKELGGEWSELLFLDNFYVNWDPVISACSNLLIAEDEIMLSLPESIKSCIGKVNSLKVSNYTEKLCLKYSIECESLDNDEIIIQKKNFYSP